MLSKDRCVARHLCYWDRCVEREGILSEQVYCQNRYIVVAVVLSEQVCCQTEEGSVV